MMTVRDFTQVFDSYAQFEESMIAAKMETSSELGREEEGTLCDCGLSGRRLNSRLVVEQAGKQRGWVDIKVRVSWSSHNCV